MRYFQLFKSYLLLGLLGLIAVTKSQSQPGDLDYESNQSAASKSVKSQSLVQRNSAIATIAQASLSTTGASLRIDKVPHDETRDDSISWRTKCRPALDYQVAVEEKCGMRAEVNVDKLRTIAINWNVVREWTTIIDKINNLNIRKPDGDCYGAVNGMILAMSQICDGADEYTETDKMFLGMNLDPIQWTPMTALFGIIVPSTCFGLLIFLRHMDVPIENVDKA